MKLIDYIDDTFSKGIKKISGKEICLVNETILPKPFEDFIDKKVESIDDLSIEIDKNINDLIITPEITTINYDWDVPWNSVVKIHLIYQYKGDVFIVCSKDSIQSKKPIRIKSTYERKEILVKKFKEKGKQRKDMDEYNKKPRETKMDIDKLKDDIRKLIFKYSSGTYIDNLTVNELKELEHDVYWLIKEGKLNKLTSKNVDPEE